MSDVELAVTAERPVGAAHAPHHASTDAASIAIYQMRRHEDCVVATPFPPLRVPEDEAEAGAGGYAGELGLMSAPADDARGGEATTASSLTLRARATKMPLEAQCLRGSQQHRRCRIARYFDRSMRWH